MNSHDNSYLEFALNILLSNSDLDKATKRELIQKYHLDVNDF